MPFTFAHPAIVLPFQFLKKYKLSLTALIIGSIVPDFEYFIKMKGERQNGHSLAGIFWFDLPLAILLSFIFHLLVRNPLLSNLPTFIQRKFLEEKRFDWVKFCKTNAPIVLLSFIIGIVSHLFLDGFTNKNGFFVQHIPLLQQYIRTDYTSIYFNNILSYLLSFVGCLIILIAIVLKPSDKKGFVSKPAFAFWLLILFFTLFVVYFKIDNLGNERMKKYWYLYVSNYAIIGISAFLISLGITSVLFGVKEKINTRSFQ
jgi:hypothetical protein